MNFMQGLLGVGGVTLVFALLGRVVPEPNPKSESAGESGTSVVDHAYKICAAMEATNLTTGCEVSGWNHSIDVRIDMSGSAARETCGLMVSKMAELAPGQFESKWTLQLFSPYSGDHPVATCTLL